MINNATLIGRLTKDIDLKFTGNGKAVASFTLAVNRNFKNADGNTEVDFINCVAWGKTAELMANHLGRGSQIGVVGRIQTRNYENPQGQRVYITEVVIQEFSFLEPRQSQNNNNFSNNQSSNYSGVDISDDLPF